MKILLGAVNAKYIHSNPAVYSLRAYAIETGRCKKEEIQVAEYTTQVMGQPANTSSSFPVIGIAIIR